MRARRLVLLCALLTAAVAVPAHSAGYESPRADEAVDTHHPATGRNTAFQELGDVTGDRIGDVLLTRRLSPGGQTSTVLLEVRDGDTGRLLWRTSVATPAPYLPDIYVTKVGPTGRPGVVVSHEERGTGNQVLQAFDFAGRRAWSKRFAHPSVRAVLDGPGSSDGILVMQFSTPVSPPVIQRLDTARGELTQLVPGAQPADAKPTGDLDDDGGQDVLVVLPGAVEARNGRTGGVIWTQSFLGTVNDVRTAGDVVSALGAPAPDVLVVTSLGPSLSQAVVLEGRTGALTWTTTVPVGGVRGLPLVKAGRPAVPAVGLWWTASSSDGRVFTERVVLEAYSTAGSLVAEPLWHKELTATAGVDAANQHATGDVTVLGDVDGDGSRDAKVEVRAFGPNGQQIERHLYTGTGTEVRFNWPQPLWAGVTPGAMDFVTFYRWDNKAQVQPVNGRTMWQRWTAVLPGPQMRDGLRATGGYLHSPRCADVLVIGTTGTSTYLWVIASDGRLRWHVAVSSDRFAGGAPHTASPRPRPRC